MKIKAKPALLQWYELYPEAYILQTFEIAGVGPTVQIVS